MSDREGTYDRDTQTANYIDKAFTVLKKKVSRRKQERPKSESVSLSSAVTQTRKRTCFRTTKASAHKLAIKVSIKRDSWKTLSGFVHHCLSSAVWSPLSFNVYKLNKMNFPNEFWHFCHCAVSSIPDLDDNFRNTVSLTELYNSTLSIYERSWSFNWCQQFCPNPCKQYLMISNNIVFKLVQRLQTHSPNIISWCTKPKDRIRKILGSVMIPYRISEIYANKGTIQMCLYAGEPGKKVVLLWRCRP